MDGIKRKATRVAALLIATLCGCDSTFGSGVQDYNYPVAGEYRVWRTSANRIHVMRGNSTSGGAHIPAKVVEIAWDETFVLAKREHGHQVSPFALPPEQDQWPERYSYYIINAKDHSLFGPLTEPEFRDKRKQLGISPSLSLRNVGDFAR